MSAQADPDPVLPGDNLIRMSLPKAASYFKGKNQISVKKMKCQTLADIISDGLAKESKSLDGGPWGRS